MIPMVDVNLVSQLKSKIFNVYSIPLVWAPLAQGRAKVSVVSDSGAAYRTSAETPNSQKNTNLVGASVFRTGIQFDEPMHNVPRAHTGIHYRNLDDTSVVPPREEAFARMPIRRNVTVEYEIGMWSYRLSDLNNIDRLLSFVEIYNPVLVEYDGDEYRFALEADSPTYNPEPEQRSEKVRIYEFTKSIRVHTFWYLEPIVRTIVTADIEIYNRITSGDVIEDELIEEFLILPKPRKADLQTSTSITSSLTVV